MPVILTVTTPATETRLTTVERVKMELGVATSENDALLLAKIDEASSDIEAHLGRRLCLETVSESFYGEITGWGYRASSPHTAGLVLARWPVDQMVSVTVDGAVTTEYLLDARAGMLFSADSAGAMQPWGWTGTIVVVYAAGYRLPGEASRNLPAVLEAACIELVQSYWFTRGRDPTVRGEDVPGLGSVQYWVGAIGQSGELPPSVMSKIMPFKRHVFA